MIWIIALQKMFFSLSISLGLKWGNSCTSSLLKKTPHVIPPVVGLIYFPTRHLQANRYLSLLLIPVLFLAAPVFSNDAPDRTYDADHLNGESSEWYVGARAGFTYKYHACVNMALECDRNDSGYGIFAGYQSKRFGLELAISDLGDTKAVYPNVTLNGEIQTVDLSLIYKRNLYRHVDIYGKLGVAYWEGEVRGWENMLEDTGYRPTAGIGLQFPLFSNVKGRVEYQYHDQIGNYWMGYTDSHFVNFSLVWTFPSFNKHITSTPKNSLHKTSSLKEISNRNSLSTQMYAAPMSTAVSQDTIHQHVESVLSGFIAGP